MITIRLVCYLFLITNFCYSHYIPPERRPNIKNGIPPKIELEEMIRPIPIHQMDVVLEDIPQPPYQGSNGNGNLMNRNDQPPDMNHLPEPMIAPPPPLPNHIPINDPDRNGAQKVTSNKDNANDNDGNNSNNNNNNSNNIPDGSLNNDTLPYYDDNNSTAPNAQGTYPASDAPKIKKKYPFYYPQFPLDFNYGYNNGSRKPKEYNAKSKKHNHRHPRNDSVLLSTYLINEVLQPYANYCFANLLSSGYLDISIKRNDKQSVYIKNISLHTPTIVIRCNDSAFDSKTNKTDIALSKNFSTSSSQFLLSIALDIEKKLNTPINITKNKFEHGRDNNNNNNRKKPINDHKGRHNHKGMPTVVVNNVDNFLFKVSFNHSLVMILFLQTTACVGSWMILLILIFLPSDSRIRSLPITCYVLLYVIVQTVYMHRTINEVFIPQYRLNIQDVFFYEYKILSANSYKICELLIHITCHINWIVIVYYMFHKDTTNNQRRNTIFVQSNRKSTDFYNDDSNSKNPSIINTMENSDCNPLPWVPAFTNNRNRLIITIGIILLLLGNIPFGILLWMGNLSGVRGLYKAAECLIYTVFLCSTFIYIWCNFGNVLIRQRVKRKVKLTLRNKIKVLWEDYYQMIPILIYNIVSFVLSYFCTIYFTTKGIHLSRWRFNFVYLLNMLITVNVWGLIAAFKKREITLNKTTILGRKIDNADPFFFDFKNEASGTSTNKSRDSFDSDISISDSNFDGNHQTNKKKLKDNKVVKPSKLKHPFSTWKSKISRMKDNRSRSKKMSKNANYKNGCPLRGSSKHSNNRLGVPNDCYVNENSNTTVNNSDKDHNIKSTTAEVNMNSFSTSYDDRSDSQSVETELTRNVIYYYDNNDSTHSDIAPMRTNNHEHVE